MFEWLKRLFSPPRDEVVCEDQTFSASSTMFHIHPDARRVLLSDNDMAPDTDRANAAPLARVIIDPEDPVFWASVRVAAEKKLGTRLSDKTWNDPFVRERWRQRLNMVK